MMGICFGVSHAQTVDHHPQPSTLNPQPSTGCLPIASLTHLSRRSLPRRGSLLLLRTRKAISCSDLKINPMKNSFLLLTAALSLVAASAYAQTAKTSPPAGGSTSPSTPATIASAIDREI